MCSNSVSAKCVYININYSACQYRLINKVFKYLIETAHYYTMTILQEVVFAYKKRAILMCNNALCEAIFCFWYVAINALLCVSRYLS